MAEELPDSAVTKVLGPPLGAAAGALIAWVGAAGALSYALTTALAVLGGIVGVAFSVIYKRYVGLLAAGAKDRDSLERQDYDRLRASFAEGGGAARIYTRSLTRLLDWVDKFFGDAGMADRTLFPHALGLRTPAPLWTAPALDRRLLLALIYPIVTIFAIWAISGYVGPAERALSLQPDWPGWVRCSWIALLGPLVIVWRRSILTFGWRAFLWRLVAGVVAFRFLADLIG